jgi:hypothetical protein
LMVDLQATLNYAAVNFLLLYSPYHYFRIKECSQLPCHQYQLHPFHINA